MEQQFVPPIQINFAGENKNDLFGVPMERALQLVDAFTNISANVIKNYDAYSVQGTGKHKGKYRLDEGKITSEYLTHAANLQEWLFILYNSTMLVDEIRNYHQQRTAAFDEIFSNILRD